MDSAKVREFVSGMWDDSIIPELCEYIKIPAKSPLFDPDWEKNGYMDEAVALMERWCLSQPIKGMKVEVARLPGRTPLLFCEIPGDSDETVLLYGHLDKQPWMEGWDEGLGPTDPVLRGEYLYGRGGADDGYSAFSCMLAIKNLQL